MQKQYYQCDFCGATKLATLEEGAPGWGQIKGAAWNGVDNPLACVVCFGKIKQSILKINFDKEE